jgi:prefoldin subunit 5
MAGTQWETIEHAKNLTRFLVFISISLFIYLFVHLISDVILTIKASYTPIQSPVSPVERT